MPESGPIIIRRKKVTVVQAKGGNWKVAYADFVTALMAFFMVMWIMGMTPEIRSMVQGYFNDPSGFVKNPPKSHSPFPISGSAIPRTEAPNRQGPGIMDRAQGDMGELVSMQQQVITRIGADIRQDDPAIKMLKNVEVKVTEEGLRIEMLDSAATTFFESGRAVILPEARALIKRMAPVLAASGRKIVVEGHTDAAPYPSMTYTNWDLSTDRALAVRRALAEFGVSAKQFSEVRGYADTKLKKPDDPLHFSNRRVSVLIPAKSLKELQDESLADELQRDIRNSFVRPVRIAP